MIGFWNTLFKSCIYLLLEIKENWKFSCNIQGNLLFKLTVYWPPTMIFIAIMRSGKIPQLTFSHMYLSWCSLILLSLCLKNMPIKYFKKNGHRETEMESSSRNVLSKYAINCPCPIYRKGSKTNNYIQRKILRQTRNLCWNNKTCATYRCTSSNKNFQ